MIRRFNYTSRTRVNQGDVSLSLRMSGDDVLATATADFDDYELAADARLHLEVYKNQWFHRFDCGTVASPKLPSDAVLPGINSAENLKFRLKVVDAAGKLLGLGDQLRPHGPAVDAAGQAKSLLPVEQRDLGQQVWRLEFPEDSSGPILVLNSRIDDVEELFRFDGAVQALVLPAVLRQILDHALTLDELFEQDNTEAWQAHWLRFVGTFYPREVPDSAFQTHDPPELTEWIDDAVSAFCEHINARDLLTDSILMDRRTP